VPERYLAELAWLGGSTAARDVLIEVDRGAITAVTPGAPPTDGARRLPGLTLPGFANTHSHVFHRAVRGHGQAGVADFWAWRDLMYAVAARLNPDTLYDLAVATYAEMALAGITAVGEFHYLHHRDGGGSYADPNELGRTVARAAADAGIRITLLDTCYLQGGVDGTPLRGVQRRFGDGSASAWAGRVDQLEGTPMLRVGAAIHSVRAVPRRDLAAVARYARERGLPLHMHVSEQPAENDACLGAYGLTPVQLLHAEGALGPASTAVHATHLTDTDVRLLGATGTTVSMCCTTERDLADGVGPADRLRAAGAPLAVGSDAHMMIDLLEEARAVELDLRVTSGRRGHFSVEQLLHTLTADGAASLGWAGGHLRAGLLADFTTVRLDTTRTAGARHGDPLAHVLFGASAADVSTVVVGGTLIVDDGVHRRVPDVGRALQRAIAAVLPYRPERADRHGQK
jgi:formiminoglutamate deiminase